MSTSTSFIAGGLKLRDEQNFSWKIENFTVMLNRPKAVDAQGFEFRVGKNDPKLSSRWRIFLKTAESLGSIGIYYKRVGDCHSTADVYSECSFTVKNEKNEILLSGVAKGGNQRYYSPLKNLTGEVGLKKWIPKSKYLEVLDADGFVTIDCSFKLFAKLATRDLSDTTVEGSLEQFHEKSKAKAQSLSTSLLKINSSCEMITILTMDQVKFRAIKDILTIQSPVFEAMFRSNMKEETEGVIELKDFTASAVRVLLHYIYTGELLPNWRDMDILSQLANAAEKYQFQDLLDFLDCILPSLCDVQTAKPLLHIAVQFRMKKAEEGILQFFKKKSGKEFLKAVGKNH